MEYDIEYNMEAPILYHYLESAAFIMRVLHLLVSAVGFEFEKYGSVGVCVCVEALPYRCSMPVSVSVSVPLSVSVSVVQTQKMFVWSLSRNPNRIELSVALGDRSP